MRIALAQINAVVGDLAGNGRRMKDRYTQACKAGADLLVFPELALCGYPPEDLLHKKHFFTDTYQALEQLVRDCPDLPMVIGLADGTRVRAFNAAAFVQNGTIRATYHKGRLPNFSVFDEARYFHAGSHALSWSMQGLILAPTICYDLWDLEWLKNWLLPIGPVDLIINISASPFDVGKISRREKVIKTVARELSCAVAYCNLVGGQDELVFDGRSMVADSNGDIVARGAAFEEDLLIADIQTGVPSGVHVTTQRPPAPAYHECLDEVYRALVLGTRDYIHKNGFQKVLLGVSGGIDSALTAAIAVAAVGAENVLAVTMPSRFNSPETIADAQMLANNLGIQLHTVPIAEVLDRFDHALARVEGWNNQGLAYENLQARIRGTLLMSLSNQLGALVLTTGNKSETSVGYSTLYGDTAGGFAVIKDVPKTWVYRLSEYINRQADRELIPSATVARAPSAELRPNQKDTDSLPDYDLLDQIIEGYVAQDLSAGDLIDKGLPADEVKRVIRMIDLNEYKRRQSPPGVRITTKAFGKDRRLPITNHYRPG